MRLLRIEWHKLKPNRTFWILSGIFMAMLILAILTMQEVAGKAVSDTPLGMFAPKLYIYQYPQIWHFLTYLASFLKIIPAMIIIMMVANELTFKTLRQQIINGLSRMEFFLGKMILIVFLSLFATLVVLGLGLILGGIYSQGHDTADIFLKMDFVAAYFLQMIGYLTVAFLLGLLLRKAVFAVGVLLLYTFVLEPILIHYIPEGIAQFLPLFPFEHSVRFPLASFLPELEMQNSVGTVMFAMIGLYTLVYAGLTLLLLRKRDL